MRARYGEKGLLELVAVMSVYMMNATILRVMDHQAAAIAAWREGHPEERLDLSEANLVGT